MIEILRFPGNSRKFPELHRVVTTTAPTLLLRMFWKLKCYTSTTWKRVFWHRSSSDRDYSGFSLKWLFAKMIVLCFSCGVPYSPKWLFAKMIDRRECKDCKLYLIDVSKHPQVITSAKRLFILSVLATVLYCLTHKWMGVAWTHGYGEWLRYVCQGIQW